MFRPRLLLSVAVLATALGTAGSARDVTEEVAEALTTFDEARVSAHVHYLASPELEGRDSPSAGLTLAARHISEVFAAAGLVASPDNAQAWSAALPNDSPPEWSLVPETTDTYLRPYLLTEMPGGREKRAMRRPVVDECVLELTVGEDVPEKFVYGTDFVALAGFPGDVRGELVWAGYGITSTSERYDDFRGVDVTDKIVMIVEGEPRHKRKFNGPELTANAAIWNKVDAVAKAGARAVVVVRRPPASDKKTKKGSSSGSKDGETPDAEPKLSYRYTYASFIPPTTDSWRGAGVPGLEVSVACASALLGEDVEALADKIDRGGRPTRVKTKDREVSFRVMIEDGDVALHNVVGVVPGADLSGEIVVVGAHYDHIGVGKRGRIGLGADDNASGTAAMLEIAEAMAVAHPRRTVVFAAFSAEEDGLIGSKRLAESMQSSGQNVVAMVNLDMVGRGVTREVVCMGFAKNPQMKKVVTRAQKLAKTGVRNIEEVDDPGLFQRSDHHSFHEIGVPVVFFFEGYPLERNRDYHTWRDTVDQVDMEKVTATARLAFLTAWLLATDDEKLPAPGR